MTDYGHPLRFGAFITPTNGQPQVPVRLAQLTERLGYDLVTFQDHPYQPRFLDTPTLMAFAAARTESVTLAANVTNLPLRPPAVLARSVASLDLLSGGRAALGIGSGAFAEAAEAMGAPALTGKQRLVGLREAIEIIRALWDTDAQGGVRYRGEVHSVDGAKRGPAPAHEVPIWIGAYKPRMLALTGSHGDGWLPSFGYFPDGLRTFAEGNARIDEAAAAAGRAPSDVRRLLNVGGSFKAQTAGLLEGPVDAWVDQITELVLEHGLGGLVLATDDAATTQRFGEEVVPAVRQLVREDRAA